jgi:chromosome segregation ATPase
MSDFHGKLMNIQHPAQILGSDTYASGHRDARNFAAEIGAEADLKIRNMACQLKDLDMSLQTKNLKVTELKAKLHDLCEGNKGLASKNALYESNRITFDGCITSLRDNVHTLTAELNQYKADSVTSAAKMQAHEAAMLAHEATARVSKTAFATSKDELQVKVNSLQAACDIKGRRITSLMQDVAEKGEYIQKLNAHDRTLKQDWHKDSRTGALVDKANRAEYAKEAKDEIIQNLLLRIEELKDNYHQVETYCPEYGDDVFFIDKDRFIWSGKVDRIEVTNDLKGGPEKRRYRVVVTRKGIDVFYWRGLDEIFDTYGKAYDADIERNKP